MNVFELIYQDNGWNGVESLSGPGSGFVATAAIRDALLLIVRATGAESVLNVGCGDDLWTPDLPGYVGLDVAQTAIDRARALHPERDYAQHDARSLAGLPLFDLAICRDALQHVPLKDGRAMIQQIRQHSQWMLLSTYRGTVNLNVPAGGFYSPDLTARPFRLPEPWLLIPDGYDYSRPGRVRDATKYLGLWAS